MPAVLENTEMTFYYKVCQPPWEMTQERYAADKDAASPWDATKFSTEKSTAYVVEKGAQKYSFMNADINSIPDGQGWRIQWTSKEACASDATKKF